MHTIWKGNVSFGLINIGVKLHSVIEDKDVKLKSLHKDCLTPIRYKKVSPDCEDDDITEDEIVKAYEYAKDKYVVINESEIQSLKKKYEVKTVDIVDFIKLDEIDPIYFNNSYYLSPEEGQQRAYSLLCKALSDTNKVGIAKITMRSNQQLAVIRTLKNALVLETIHYPDEVRAVDNVPHLSTAAIDDRELAAAKVLIEQLTVPFNPAQYTNEYRTALMDLIQSKIDDKQIADKPDVRPNKDNVVSLMDILQASIEQTKKPDVAAALDKTPNKPKKRKSTPRKKTS